MNEKKITITPTDTPATSGYLNAREASLLLQEVQTLHDRLDRVEKSLVEIKTLLADRAPPTAAGMSGLTDRIQRMFGKVDERSKKARTQNMFGKVDERS